MARALRAVRRARRRAERRDGVAIGDGGDAVGSWREAFLGAPYVRDVLVAMGVLARDVRDGDHVGALPGASTSA